MVQFYWPIMRGSTKPTKSRAPRNSTIDVLPGERDKLRSHLIFNANKSSPVIRNKIFCADAFEILKNLPAASFDLLFADPPYNLTKAFGKETFSELTSDEYEVWLDSWLQACVPLLKPDADLSSRCSYSHLARPYALFGVPVEA